MIMIGKRLKLGFPAPFKKSAVQVLGQCIRRGSHVLKALSVGAKACSDRRLYFYALAAAGQPGVERAVGKLRDEIERGMKLMGARSVADLGRGNLRWR
jgi:L-lactate dehydrogenase (cytochrome)